MNDRSRDTPGPGPGPGPVSVDGPDTPHTLELDLCFISFDSRQGEVLRVKVYTLDLQHTSEAEGSFTHPSLDLVQ